MGDWLDDVANQLGYGKPAPPPVTLNGSAANPTPSIDDGRTRGWAEGIIAKAVERIATAAPGNRNGTLNSEAWSAYHKVCPFFSDAELEEIFLRAADQAGLIAEDGYAQCLKTIRSGFGTSISGHGGTTYQNAPRTESGVEEVGWLPGREPVNGHSNGQSRDDAQVRRFITTLPQDVEDRLPVWAWEYEGKGRIQLGTLALFAGRPGAGKSTAARWFAGLITRGELPGQWFGEPQIVTYIAPAEESLEYIIKPGLRAAGADLRYVRFHQVIDADGKPTRLLSTIDEESIINELLNIGCKVVIVDPVMSTISSAADINRNNETRAYVEPWARIADRINGIVVGVVHLRKNSGGDVVSAITGSSAFGEVARAVFGFAKDPNSDDGDRIMSQHKNSTGDEDMSVVYRIRPTEVVLDSGERGGVGQFVLIGNADMTVEDLMTQSEVSSPTREARDWIEDYLMQQGRTRVKQVIEEGKREGHPERTLYRAAKRLRVRKVSEGFPRASYWELPKEEDSIDFSEPGREASF